MGKFSSKDVYVIIKDADHLKELYDLCEKYNKPIFKVKYKSMNNYFSHNIFGRKFACYYYEIGRIKVTTEQFEEILKSEQQCQK